MGLLSSITKSLKAPMQEAERFRKKLTRNENDPLSGFNQKIDIANYTKGEKDDQARKEALAEAQALKAARNALTPMPDETLLQQYARRKMRKSSARGGRLSTVLTDYESNGLGG